MRTNITTTSMELLQSPQKTFCVRTIQDGVQGLHRLAESVKEQRYVGIYDVESFFWGGVALKQLYGIFGAHLEFQNRIRHA